MRIGNGRGTGTAGATILATAVLALATAAPLRGQAEGPQRLSLDARGGVALGAGEMAALTDPGWTVGAGATVWATPTVGLRVGGDLERFSSDEEFGSLQDEGPELRLWHATAGVALRFRSGERPRLGTVVSAGAGLAVFDSESFRAPAPGGSRLVSFEEVYFAPYASGRVFYRLGRDARAWVGGRARLILASDETTGILQQASGGEVRAFEATWTFPVQLGFSFLL